MKIEPVRRSVDQLSQVRITLTQGWKKPGFKKKTSPVGFFGFFWVFWVFLGFLGFFAQKRGFVGFFSVSQILLGASRLQIIITPTN
jgi:hypothetical protein